MMHFRGIEGLRGWLAVVVILDHIFGSLGYFYLNDRFRVFQGGGDLAVLIFVIISGFVITNLLLVKRESYLPYITRRFLRLYPVYILCLLLGMVSYPFLFDTLRPVPWPSLTHFAERMARDETILSNGGWFNYLVTHLSLFHGLLGNNVLWESQYMFLGPAWSLSLEWQFYLVAPIIVLWAADNPRRALAIAVVCVIATVMYQRGQLGYFFSPSALPSAIVYFAAGIGTRLIIERLPRPKRFPLATAVVLLSVAIWNAKLLPFCLWASFVMWMLVDPSTDDPIAKVGSRLLDSEQARWLGARSYPLYLIHEPIIFLSMFAGIKLLAFGMVATTIFVAIIAIAASFLGAILLHRYVELPCVDFGKALFREKASLSSPDPVRG